jgi:hypothetical protein
LLRLCFTFDSLGLYNTFLDLKRPYDHAPSLIMLYSDATCLQCVDIPCDFKFLPTAAGDWPRFCCTVSRDLAVKKLSVPFQDREIAL